MLIVDGVHGFGVENVDAASLGADFFVASCHKWLLAPRGTGVVWGRADVWPAIRPTIPNFDPDGGAAFGAWIERSALPPTRAAFVSPGGFIAYEHQFAIADAIGFHRCTVGREIDRGGCRAHYKAARAQERCVDEARRPKQRWFEERPWLWEVVVGLLLVPKWSPRQISARLRAEHPGDPPWWVSHAAVYLALTHTRRSPLSI